MSDLNENRINDPAHGNAQNEGAFNNPALNRTYQASIGQNPPAAKRAAIARAVQEGLERDFCRSCSGSGHRGGGSCPDCDGAGHVRA